MAAPTGKEDEKVELGFVEKTDSWRLDSKYFPCKVGGTPSWLHLKSLPPPEEVQCSSCKNPCIFLIQIYAPIDELKTCFHRTVFLFCCRSPECYKPSSNSPFVVFRSQLPRKNDYYDYEPADDSETEPLGPIDFDQRLCVICGCLGPKRCGKCHKTNYCSRQHQTVHWKSGHKSNCGKTEGAEPEENKLLFPEYELVIETEELRTVEKPEKSETDKMKEYAQFMQSEKGKSTLKNDDMTEEDLEKMAFHEDIQFKKFRERVNHDPAQVLRYDRGGEPLWISSEHIPQDGDIPYCQCGAPRSFEFQILPQLLSHLRVDSLGASIDWGTLAVYTCSKSCDAGHAYHPEFVWKQDCNDNASKK